MTHSNLRKAAAGLIALLCVGCSSNRVTASDSQITSDIQSKLYADPATKQSSIAVAVVGGAVTLTGEVPSADVELAAMKIANSTTGVHGVADQLKVTTTAASAQPMSDPAAANLASSPTAPAPAPARRVPAAVPVQTPRVETPAPVQSARVSDPNYAPATGGASPARSSDATAVERPRERPQITIASGERLSVRTIDAIDSNKSSAGQAMPASLEAPLVSNGQVIVPAGAPVTLQIGAVKGAGRIKGNSELSLQATSLEYLGRNYPITTSVLEQEGKGRGKNTALKTGIGAGVGALIGGLAGGGKGAGIGLAAGGGAGFGINALSHGQQVKIPSETVLSFRLEAPLTVPAPR